MVFEILNTRYGFLEGFQKTFQLAALLAFAAAGALALFSARDRRSRKRRRSIKARLTSLAFPLRKH